MSPSSMEVVGFAVVLGVVAIAAVVSLFRRPRSRTSTNRGENLRRPCHLTAARMMLALTNAGAVATCPHGIGLGVQMYVPALFKEDRVPVLHDAIRRAALATLVTVGPNGIDASHVPMLLDPEPAPFGTLCGHIARANPQWQEAAADLQALAIFLGPDAYITPSWYATKRQTGKVVPTWNYVAVHAHGRVRFFEDPEHLLALVTKLTDAHEAARPKPWAVTDAPEQFIRGHLASIVGFEIPITRLEGKWKMSQNRPAEDRIGVVEGLEREGGEAVAAAGEAQAVGGGALLPARAADPAGVLVAVPGRSELWERASGSQPRPRLRR